MSRITIDGISKDFGAGAQRTQVLRNLQLEIPTARSLSCWGRLAAENPRCCESLRATSGRVLLDGEDITQAEPSEHGLAMVFQNDALYPHMTVYGNVEYGLKVAKVPKEERRRRVMEALAMVELTDQAGKLPAKMSGGQRQRVALGRAIVKKPKVFLMDEPLSNLDAKLRGQMRETISGLYHRLGCTFLYVTHDQVEAMSMGANIVLLQGGNIMQQGTPRSIYTEPQNVFAAGFIGSPPCNVMEGPGFKAAIRCEEVLPGTSREGVNLHARVRGVEQPGRDSIYNLETSLGLVHMKAVCTWEEKDEERDVTMPYGRLMYFDEEGHRIPATRGLSDALQEHADRMAH